MKDYYNILGVGRGAAADEIKRAYRKLASQYHPDKGGDTAKFQEIEEAYRVLSDPEQRSAYDNPHTRFNFNNGNFQQNFNFNDIFEMFGTRFGQQHQQPQPVVRMGLWISLIDSAQGGIRTVSVGTRHATSTVDIQIPVGIDNEESVKYPRLGPGGSDLIITFKIHPNPLWERRGLDLYTEQKLSIWDLIKGTDLTVRNVLHKELVISVKPMTQPGSTLRLRGHGMPHRNGTVGDLMVRVQATLPEHIPEELLESIKKYSQ